VESAGSALASNAPPPSPREPEPEPEPPLPDAATAALAEFWIPFHEIKFGQPIDSGAFGTVYRGNYLGPVAVKSIRQRGSDAAAEGASAEGAAQQRLLQGRLAEEIRAQTRFHHQNIVQFLGLASGSPPPPSSPGEYWLVVTELCDTNLYKVLHSSRDLAWNSRFKMALDIARESIDRSAPSEPRNPLTPNRCHEQRG